MAQRRLGRGAIVLTLTLVAGAVGSAPGVAVAFESTPVAHWPLDEGTGTAAEDAVGSADGVLDAGAAWASEPAEGGSALDSSGGGVTVTSTAALEPGEVTVSAWIRSDGSTTPADGTVIVEKGAFDCVGPSYGLYVAGNGLELRWRGVGTVGGHPIVQRLDAAAAGVDNLWDGAWHLVGMGVENSSANRTTISIDGVPRTPTHVSGSRYWSSGQASAIVYDGATATDLAIGRPVADCGADRFPGTIDNVRIWVDWYAASQLGELMDPIETTTTLLTEGPFTVGGYETVQATVSPQPRIGILRFHWVNPETDEVVSSTSATLTDGVYGAQMYVPPTGTWILRAAFGPAPPWLASSDAKPILIEHLASTTSLAAAPDPVVPGRPTTLTAVVESESSPFEPAPTGVVEFVLSPGPDEAVLGSAQLGTVDYGRSRASIVLPSGFSVGTHALAARYLGTDRRAPSTGFLDLVVGAAASATTLIGTDTIETHHAVTLEASVQAATDGWWAGATIAFRRAGGGATACTVPASQSNFHSCTIASLPVGTASFEAVYSGNASTAGSTSPAHVVTVTADTVQATAVKINYATFYPYKDAYRDALTLSGSRHEPLSVAIRIYSPSGALVRSATVARSSGGYTYGWNGRTAGGTILAAGKYRVVQTLTDAFGTSRAYTHYATLSTKRLVTKTTYVTRLGSLISASGDPGTGSIVMSTSGGYAKLTARYPDGWVAVGYQFTLPAAVVYKSIGFQVYGKGPLSAPQKQIGLQNFRTCPLASGAWDEACFDRWAVIGSSSSTTRIWQSTSGSVTTNLSGRTVRGLVAVPISTHTVYSARVRVVYGILE